MRNCVMAGVAGLLLATSAQAAPTGARVEGIVGWDKNKLSVAGFDLDKDGVVFGLGLGYDFGLGEAVSAGVDLEVSDSSAKLKVFDATGTASVSTGRDLYAGGRLTFAVSPKANLYVKAGYTNARITARVQTATLTDTSSGNADGIRGGAGVQFLLTDKLYLGGEYRYSNYEADYSRHQVVGTVGFRF
ncbi:porin family protein [Sphingomonas sp. ID1715]|uniref:outer membrane protein n=1 Tax=Sphingomonas sp. ID1715 TaxID=1656898 RepID=UPI00148A0EC3|nr:porin family protein [Sphingomonas sp. ID1715]NNM78760.1 porin family protein [Sphingomonas sp. ID1715]